MLEDGDHYSNFFMMEDVRAPPVNRIKSLSRRVGVRCLLFVVCCLLFVVCCSHLRTIAPSHIVSSCYRFKSTAVLFYLHAIAPSCYRFKSTAVLFYLHAIVSSCYRFKSTAVLFYLYAIASSCYRFKSTAVLFYLHAIAPSYYRTFAHLSFLTSS